MITVCAVCGDRGYTDLLLSCRNCNGAAVHQYCLDKVVYDGTSIDWSCYECHPSHGVVTKKRSLEASQDDKTVVGTEPENDWAASALDNNHDKPGTDGGSDDLMLERNKDRFQLHDRANNDLQQISMAASVSQPSILHEDSVPQTMPSSANADGLTNENNCLPSGHTEIGNPKGSCVGLVLTEENQSERSMLLDGAYISSIKKESSEEKIVQEASAPQMEHSDAVQNLCKDNPRKQRKLILLDDDDDDLDVELSNTVQNFDKDNPRKRRKLILRDDVWVELSDNVQNLVRDNPRKPRQLILLDDDDEQEDAEKLTPLSLECERPIKKHRVDTEFYAKEAVQTGTGCLKGQSLKNDRPVNKQECLEDDEHDAQLDSLVPQPVENTCPIKKRRRYIDPNDDEEEEIIVGSVNSECALKDVAKMASQPVDAKDHHLQSRMTFDSHSVNDQYYIYSQPIDVPVWSGIFKTESNVPVMLAAHLSTKACPRVFEFARSLPPVVEVLKLPRLEAWPKRWNTSGPTDDSIGLYFFPHSMRSNEESDRLVKEVIESDFVLKVILGTVELLMFPSNFLPEQYHVFQGRYYLWGVFKPRKDNPDTAVLVEDQAGLACVSEEGEVQEHQVLDQQYKVECMSSDEGSFVVKHVENQVPVEEQKVAMQTALREGSVSPDSFLSCNEPNPAESGSNRFPQPRIDHKYREPGVADQQEDEQDFTSLPGSNDPNVTKAPGETLRSATTLFGFVAARTARSQQLIQEMVSEGAVIFTVPEERATSGCNVGKSNGGGVVLTPVNGYQHIQERRHPIEFVPIDHGNSDTASEACLELFPVRQEQIALIPRVDVNKEVELDLSLGTCR